LQIYRKLFSESLIDNIRQAQKSNSVSDFYSGAKLLINISAYTSSQLIIALWNGYPA